MRTVWRAVTVAIAAAVALAMVTLVLLFRFWIPAQESPRRTPPYTIGSWQGQVAVFEGAQRYPMQVFDTAVNALPEEARKKVLEGIPVEDAAQLSALLEDYTS